MIENSFDCDKQREILNELFFDYRFYQIFDIFTKARDWIEFTVNLNTNRNSGHIFLAELLATNLGDTGDITNLLLTMEAPPWLAPTEQNFLKFQLNILAKTHHKF